MSSVTNLFVTPLYRAKLNDLAKKKVNYEELRDTCIAIAEEDEAGQEWCEREGYPGYTTLTRPWTICPGARRSLPIWKRPWTSMWPRSVRLWVLTLMAKS